MEAKDVHGRLTIGFREKNGDEYTFDDVKSSLGKSILRVLRGLTFGFMKAKIKMSI